MNDNNDKVEKSVKVVLTGEAGVGKTSIIYRFVKEAFDPNLMSTNGATFSSKKIFYKEKKTELCFEIWDTAGQERYRSLTKMYFKGASIALIVYDITKKKTFDEIQNYWMNIVKENGPKDIIIYLIGNKLD